MLKNLLDHPGVHFIECVAINDKYFGVPVVIQIGRGGLTMRRGAICIELTLNLIPYFRNERNVQGSLKFGRKLTKMKVHGVAPTLLESGRNENGMPGVERSPSKSVNATLRFEIWATCQRNTNVWNGMIQTGVSASGDPGCSMFPSESGPCGCEVTLVTSACCMIDED